MLGAKSGKGPIARERVMGAESKVSAWFLGSIGLATVLLLDWLDVIHLPSGYAWPAILLCGGVSMIRWVTDPASPEQESAGSNRR